MNVLVINLRGEKARWSAISKRLSGLGIRHERLEARTDADERMNSFRWWCAVLRPCVKGELGCAGSHREAYRRLVESHDKCLCILEDDALVNGMFPKALELAEAQCSLDPKSVVLLGRHHCGKEGDDFTENAGASLRLEDETWDHCSEGYVIGRRAAEILMAKQRSIRVPADWWSYFRHKRWINLKRVVPSVCGQDVAQFASSLGERYVAARQSMPERLWWKCRRIAGVVIDAVLDGRSGWW